MALQYSTTLRNNQLDQIESTAGASSILRMLSGAPPADCSQAQTGTLIAEITLPSDWMAAASNGSVAKSGTWEDISANNGGTLGHFRIYNSAGTVCHIQGTIATAAADMIVDNTSVNSGQKITVTTFTISAGNA